jgi:hypothetical protein
VRIGRCVLDLERRVLIDPADTERCYANWANIPNH